MIPMELEGRVALITGASRGIGRALAIAFAKEGADIIINYNSSLREAEKVQKEIEMLGRRATPYHADLKSPSQISDLVKKSQEYLGNIDILVNNAGVLHRSPFLAITEIDFDDMIDTNLKGTFFCSREVADSMITQGKKGVILNISSVSGIRHRKDEGMVYGISKAGVNYLTQSLALTLAPHNIRVNAIAPGYTQTDLTNYSDKKRKEKEKKIPLGHMNELGDITNLAVYLVSERSQNITGQIISVCGGSSIS